MSHSSHSDFVVIVNRAAVDRPLEHVWTRVGGFFDLHLFLDVTCRAISGAGDVGSVRQVGEAVIEAMVSAGRYSYTYAQTEGPMSAFTYHGSVACEPNGDGAEIVYTLVYDQAKIADDRRASEKSRLTQRFAGAVEAMKRAAES